MLLKSASIYTVFLFLSTVGGIWNGRPATINRFPYAALIIANYNTTINDLGEWDCSGALISDMFVITAAFCVKGIQKFRIKLGAHYNGHLTETVFDNFDYVYDHTMWSKPYYAKAIANSTNELAMIALKPRVNFTPQIQPVTLPSPLQYNVTHSNYSTLAAGWGLNERNKQDLQWLRMRTISDSDCSRQYPGIDIRTMLCAQGDEIDGRRGVVCRDVGAPLALDNFTLIGISLYTRPCNEEGPELFARIDWFVDWIRRVDSMKFNKTLYPYYVL